MGHTTEEEDLVTTVCQISLRYIVSDIAIFVLKRDVKLQLTNSLRYTDERKGKERKSIYIASFCTKVHTKHSGMDHTVLPANNTMPDFLSSAFTRWHHHNN